MNPWPRLAPWILLAVGLAIAGSWIRAGRGQLREARRQLEATEAELVGLKAAAIRTEAELRREADSLDEQIADLEGKLDEIGAAGPQVREVVKWRTKEIPVQGSTLAERICPDTPTPEGDSGPSVILPDLKFRVNGTEARIETRAGNRFAVGRVDLFLTEPRPELFLGSAPFDAPLTELSMTPPAGTSRPERWAVGLSVIGGQFRGVGVWGTGDLWRLRGFTKVSWIEARGYSPGIPGPLTYSGASYEAGVGWKF